jgi:hypothetical protein
VVFGLFFWVPSVFGGVFGILLELFWYWIATVLLLVCLSGWGVVLSVGGLDEKWAWDSNHMLSEDISRLFPLFLSQLRARNVEICGLHEVHEKEEDTNQF